MSQHDTLTQAPADEVERIIRSAVAAMPNTNPLVADDLIAGHTMHTEAEDIVAIWRAALSATQPAQAAQSEPVKPLFASNVAARKWAELQEQGARMQSIAFDGGKGGAGTIDPWGVVLWDQAQQAGEPT